MITSMTGYGRARSAAGGREITVEIKSVNSRYFEYSSRMPRAYAFLDDKMKQYLAGRLARGKVEVALSVVNTGVADSVVKPNYALADSYCEAIRNIASTLGLRDEVSALSIAKFPDVLTISKAEEDEDALWNTVLAVLTEATDRFIAMRAGEGERMTADILGRLSFLEESVAKIETTSGERVQKYTDRLYEKLKTLLEDRAVDESRILTEAAIFADKTAVDEETVRLRSHIQQYREILATGGPVGRKLDFLTQELNRETNTIGSKCQELSITRMVVDMKAEIEKIREQIQNLE